MLSSCILQVEKNPMNQKQIPWYKIPAERWRDAKHDHYCQRDSQRQKLYDAQWVAYSFYPLFTERKLASLEAIQRYVDRLTKETWFVHRFGEHCITVKKKREWCRCAKMGRNYSIFGILSKSIHSSS